MHRVFKGFSNLSLKPCGATWRVGGFSGRTIPCWPVKDNEIGFLVFASDTVVDSPWQAQTTERFLHQNKYKQTETTKKGKGRQRERAGITEQLVGMRNRCSPCGSPDPRVPGSRCSVAAGREQSGGGPGRGVGGATERGCAPPDPADRRPLLFQERVQGLPVPRAGLRHPGGGGQLEGLSPACRRVPRKSPGEYLRLLPRPAGAPPPPPPAPPLIHESGPG